jgi:hypothetical protein
LLGFARAGLTYFAINIDYLKQSPDLILHKILLFGFSIVGIQKSIAAFLLADDSIHLLPLLPKLYEHFC